MSTPIHTKSTFERDWASIEFKMGETIVTEYILQDNTIIVPTITSTVESDVTSGVNALIALQQWLRFASNTLTTTGQDFHPYKLELEVSTDEVKFKFEINSNLLSDASFNKQTKIITWNPHPAATLAWSDFKHWIVQLAKFYKIIRNV